MEALEIDARNNCERVGDVPAAVDPAGDAPRSFSLGDVGREFGAGFLDEGVCRWWILKKIHGDGQITCPECHVPLTDVALRRFWEGNRICCRACGKYFTALTKTFLGGCHMNFREIILLADFLHRDYPAREIARILRISPENVRLWEKKFQGLERMKAMAENGTEQVRACRVCGCTDDRACEGGCWWVEDPAGGDLCSRCEKRLRQKLMAADDLTEGSCA